MIHPCFFSHFGSIPRLAVSFLFLFFGLAKKNTPPLSLCWRAGSDVFSPINLVVVLLLHFQSQMQKKKWLPTQPPPCSTLTPPMMVHFFFFWAVPLLLSPHSLHQNVWSSFGVDHESFFFFPSPLQAPFISFLFEGRKKGSSRFLLGGWEAPFFFYSLLTFSMFTSVISRYLRQQKSSTPPFFRRGPTICSCFLPGAATKLPSFFFPFNSPVAEFLSQTLSIYGFSCFSSSPHILKWIFRSPFFFFLFISLLPYHTKETVFPSLWGFFSQQKPKVPGWPFLFPLPNSILQTNNAPPKDGMFFFRGEPSCPFSPPPIARRRISPSLPTQIFLAFPINFIVFPSQVDGNFAGLETPFGSVFFNILKSLFIFLLRFAFNLQKPPPDFWRLGFVFFSKREVCLYPRPYFFFWRNVMGPAFGFTFLSDLSVFPLLEISFLFSPPSLFNRRPRHWFCLLALSSERLLVFYPPTLSSVNQQEFIRVTFRKKDFFVGLPPGWAWVGFVAFAGNWLR